MDTDLMGNREILMAVSLVILIMLSAFFSATETAISSVNLIRLRTLAEDGNKRAKRAIGVVESFDRTLSTILVGNNVVNIASASLATVLFSTFFPRYGALISTLAMTIVVLLVGEIIPKSYAKNNSEKVALQVCGVILFLMKALSPILFLISKLTKRLTNKTSEPSVTEDELKYLIETIEDEGVLDEQESELIQSALAFDDITVQEILTPRVDLIALSAQSTGDEVRDVLVAERFSRLPVYEGTVDHIIGVVHARDVFEALLSDQPFELKHLMKDCAFVHKTMKISDLLTQFKRTKTHLAVVTDDYGGTKGIVTMEDILEQLVGEIWDENDEIEHAFVEIDTNKYIVNGDFNVYELFERLEIRDKEFDSDYSSMSGWALEMFEHIPLVGESFSYKELTVTVDRIEDRRITKLIVEKKESEQDE